MDARYTGRICILLNANALVLASRLDPMPYLGGRKRLKTGVNDIQLLLATTPIVVIIGIPELISSMLLRYDGLPLGLEIRMEHVLRERQISFTF